ncbi:MAG: N-acetyltransferase family protein [Sphingomicrobium sp.]
MSSLVIRPATSHDAPEIAAIYDHHARHGTATFEFEGYATNIWGAKIADIQQCGGLFLVGAVGGKVAGFAYVTQFRDRPAYAHTCEDSIYIAPESIGQGVGSQLLAALIAAARAARFEQMLAVVGGAEPASIALHKKFGFVERGRMKDVGRKFGRTLDTVYLQLAL